VAAATAAAHVAAATAATHVTTATATAAVSATATAVALGARNQRRSRYCNGSQYSEDSCTFHLGHGLSPSLRIRGCSRGMGTR
jgi:hypothetical protein